MIPERTSSLGSERWCHELLLDCNPGDKIADTIDFTHTVMSKANRISCFELRALI